MEAVSECSSNYARAKPRVFNYPPPPPSVSPYSQVFGNGQSISNCDGCSISSSASASLASVSSSSSGKNKPIELTCFLCKRIFVEPMILSCGHSFCLKCVEKWLRKCTNCPVCRMVTLEPIHNITLAEMLSQYQDMQREANKTSAFQRSVTQPLMRTFRRSKKNKEAKTIQQESVRASQRRPKQLDFKQPKFEHKVSASTDHSTVSGRRHSEQMVQPMNRGDVDDSLNSSVKFQRVSNLRRSFNRFRQKIGSSSNESSQADFKTFVDKSEFQRDVAREDLNQSPKDSSQPILIYNACSSVSSGYRSLTSPTQTDQYGVQQRRKNTMLKDLQVYVLSTVSGDLKYTISQAFVSNIDNVELAELPEVDDVKSPSIKLQQQADIFDSIQQADTTVLIYSAGNVVSFRRLLEFFSQPSVLPVCKDVSFLLIALKNSVSYGTPGGNSKDKLAKHQGERLARLLNTSLIEVAVCELASKVSNLFSSATSLQREPSASKLAVLQRHHTCSSSNNPSMSISEEPQDQQVPPRILQSLKISGSKTNNKESVGSLPAKKDRPSSSQCSLM